MTSTDLSKVNLPTVPGTVHFGPPTVDSFHAVNDNVYKPTNTNVFITGIPGTWMEEQVRALFEKFGTIESVRVIAPKHVAFVQYSKASEAGAAIQNMHNYKLTPLLSLFVALAEYDEGAEEVPSNRLFVRGFPPNMNQHAFRAMFESLQAGAIVNVKLVMGTDGTSRGVGYVTYSTVESARDARDRARTQQYTHDWPSGVEVKFAESQMVRAVRARRSTERVMEMVSKGYVGEQPPAFPISAPFPPPATHMVMPPPPPPPPQTIVPIMQPQPVVPAGHQYAPPPMVPAGHQYAPPFVMTGMGGGVVPHHVGPVPMPQLPYQHQVMLPQYVSHVEAQPNLILMQPPMMKPSVVPPPLMDGVFVMGPGGLVQQQMMSFPAPPVGLPRYFS